MTITAAVEACQRPLGSTTVALARLGHGRFAQRGAAGPIARETVPRTGRSTANASAIWPSVQRLKPPSASLRARTSRPSSKSDSQAVKQRFGSDFFQGKEVTPEEMAKLVFSQADGHMCLQRGNRLFSVRGIRRVRLARYTSPALPQRGQTKPWGQRSFSRNAWQASSVANQSRNSFQVRG